MPYFILFFLMRETNCYSALPPKAMIIFTLGGHDFSRHEYPVSRATRYTLPASLEIRGVTNCHPPVGKAAFARLSGFSLLAQLEKQLGVLHHAFLEAEGFA